jgi:hypothetical protein
MNDVLAKLFGGIDDLRARLEALEGEAESAALQKSAPELRVVDKSDDGIMGDGPAGVLKQLMGDPLLMDSLVKAARNASPQR